VAVIGRLLLPNASGPGCWTGDKTGRGMRDLTAALLCRAKSMVRLNIFLIDSSLTLTTAFDAYNMLFKFLCYYTSLASPLAQYVFSLSDSQAT